MVLHVILKKLHKNYTSKLLLIKLKLFLNRREFAASLRRLPQQRHLVAARHTVSSQGTRQYLTGTVVLARTACEGLAYAHSPPEGSTAVRAFIHMPTLLNKRMLNLGVS